MKFVGEFLRAFRSEAQWMEWKIKIDLERNV